MNRKEEICLEIDGIDAQIERHKSFIFELEESYKVIKMNYDAIVERALKPIKGYDLSSLSKYGQDVLKKTEEYRRNVVKETEKPLQDTLKLLSEIQDAKKQILGKMKKYENKKKKLKAELETL